MANAASIQAKIYSGYGKAAKRLGTEYTIYRASDAINPTQDGNNVGTILASFNANWAYNTANKYGTSLWQLVADGRQLQVFDYLAGTKDFFIAGMQSLLPILAVECNRTLTVTRPGQDTDPGKGIVGYGGSDAANSPILMQNCPASVLQGTRGDRNPLQLPLDTKSPFYQILLPALPGASLRVSDKIIDDRGVTMSISSAELTDLGWRLVAISTES